MSKNSENKRIFLDGITSSNPVFASLLGLCPILAISTSFDNALGMGIAVILILLLSNITISALRKLIPDEIRIPVFIVLIATFVSCIDMLMNAFTPTLYASLGIFIPLIVVNCLMLGRAEAFAYKNSVGKSILDALGMSIGYTLALLVMGFIREILANQSLVISNPFDTSQFIKIPFIESIKISFFGTPAGAFVTLAIVIAVIAAIKEAKSKKVTKKSEVK